MLRSSADWRMVCIYLSRKCDAMMTAETMMQGLAVIPLALFACAIWAAIQRCKR